ncbi:MAG: hypothetical protein H6722_30950 [Sandaracinus sp.]|nr:hypothetical protein [Sandaracinus sp.]
MKTSLRLLATSLVLACTHVVHAQAFVDDAIYTAPTGLASTLGGPTPRGEISIVRERFFSMPPVMTGSGVTLTPGDPNRDGVFAQSLFVRSGPVASNTRDPETAASMTFPPEVTVIGIADSDAELAATDATWGLSPSIDYTASSRGMEGGELGAIVVNGDGTTTVTFRTNMNNSPFTDEFRVLIDYGDALPPNLSVTFSVTTGDDVNVGGTDGGRSGSPTNYVASVPLTPTCAGCLIDGACVADGEADPTNACRACNAVVSNTAYSLAPVGTVCSDGAFCTIADSCDAAGDCVASPRDCSDSNECTVDVCNEVADRCDAIAQPFGTSCSAGICDATVTCSPVAVDLVSPVDGALINDATPSFVGTATPGITVVVTVDGTPAGTTTADASGAWSFTPGTNLSDGSHSVVVVVMGGMDTAMDGADFVVDTTTSVAITAPATGSATTDTTPTLSGTGEPGAMVTVSLDGTTLDVVTVEADGTWTVEVTAELAEGMHVVVAMAMDAAGNTAMDTSIFTVDTSTSVAIVTPADGTRVMTGTPTISGTAEPGAMVTVSVDGTELGTVTADGSGNWSIDVTTALTEGPHSASASATDTLGNTASTESDFTVDLGTTVSFEQPSVTGDETPELSGTGEPGASVEVSVDGSVVGTVIVDAEGNWTLVVGPLTDGTHDVSVTATDDAGNTANDTGSFLVDLDSPAVEIANPGDGTTTSDNTPTITGTATPGASVLVIVDGSILGIASADATGAWSIDVTTALADGEHEVVATVTDADGDTVEDAHVFTVDTADAPAIAITSPTGGAVTSDATPTITGTATAGVTVDVYVDGVFVGTVTADGDGNWSLDVGTALSDGSHTVRAVATDGDGNTATDGGTFTVDTETEVAIVAPAEGATVGGPRPTISGSAEAGASVVVSVDGTEIGTVVAGADGTWSVRVTFDLTDGDHDASATATDEVGNTATDSVDFTVGGLDTDGDGFLDTEECPSMPCRDTDMDGNPDFDDPDDDGDGIPTAVECPGATSCRDSDSDTTPDYLDPDDDDDGILTRDEGSGSRDTDSDGIPDHLDVDDDGDGLLTEDECATMPCRDTDTDGVPDFRDPDDDGDAIPTTRERADGAMHGNDVDTDGNVNWLDRDADGADGTDTEEGVDDTDGDGIPDYLDPANPVLPDGGVDGGTVVDGGIDGGPSDGGVPLADGGIEEDAGTPPNDGGYAGGALCTATGGSDPSAAVGLTLVGLALLRRRRRR